MPDDSGVFRALADSTRRQILQDLRHGELTAGDIASRFTISGPSISRHLGVLKSAGLVAERREANRIYYSLLEDRLAICVGHFLSAVCPDQVVTRRRRGVCQRRQVDMMTSATCRCPRAASILLIPIAVGLLLMDTATWAQQAWIQHYDGAAVSSVLYCAALRAHGPAVMTCTITRKPAEPTSRWRQLLRVEERTLLASVPVFLLLLGAVAAAAVIWPTWNPESSAARPHIVLPRATGAAME